MRGNTGHRAKSMTRAQGRAQFAVMVACCTDAALARHIADPSSLARSYAGVTMDQVRSALNAEHQRRTAA